MKHLEIKDIIIDLLEEIVKRTNYINHHHPEKDMSLDIDLVKDDLRLLYHNYEALKRLAHEQPVASVTAQHEVSETSPPSEKTDHKAEDQLVRDEQSVKTEQLTIDETWKEAEVPAVDPMEELPEPEPSRTDEPDDDREPLRTEEPDDESGFSAHVDDESQTVPPDNEADSVNVMPQPKQSEERSVPGAPEKSPSPIANEKPEKEIQQEQQPKTLKPADQPQPDTIDKARKPTLDKMPDHPKKIIGERYIQPDNSVHQRIAEASADKSIGTRLQQKPISNIKEVIGVNEKFLFINELFDGNIQAYYDAIARLNDADNMQLAFDYLNELGEKFAWDSSRSTATIEKLAGYVQRRYM